MYAISLRDIAPGSIVRYSIPGLDNDYMVTARVTNMKSNPNNIAGGGNGILLECISCNIPDCVGIHARMPDSIVTTQTN